LSGKRHYEIRERREKVKPGYCVERNPPALFSKGGEPPGSPYSPFTKGGWEGIWEATV